MYIVGVEVIPQPYDKSQLVTLLSDEHVNVFYNAFAISCLIFVILSILI